MSTKQDSADDQGFVYEDLIDDDSDNDWGPGETDPDLIDDDSDLDWDEDDE